VAVSGGLGFQSIGAGELSSCGVTTDGVAYCWGGNEYGQLGTGNRTASTVPVRVATQP
jgi:alpha-tubulin suppressor-like RCC1 family protein